MAIHKLYIDDFEATNFSLIAFHTNLEDYRLTYFVNQYLNLRLKKNQDDILINTENGDTHFTNFIYDDIKNDVFKDYFNFQENKLNAGNSCLTPMKSYTNGSDLINFYSGNSVSVCIFNEQNIPEYFIATKR